MAQVRKFTWSAAGLLVLLISAALILWMTPSRQTSSAQDGPRPLPPLISRGYTDAPAGTALIAGDPAGGGVLIELRITDGQKVKRDEIIAVLSNYYQGGHRRSHVGSGACQDRAGSRGDGQRLSHG